MRFLALTLLAITFSLVTSLRADGQVRIPDGPPIYSAPGFYGTLYGVPNHGAIQTYSRFASPFGGPGYGLGYGPSSILPGMGKALWANGPVDLGYSDSAGHYRTFRAMPVAEYPTYLPPFGYYAPGFGPPYFIE